MSDTSSKINIAVFASGSGSNAENLYKYFKNGEVAEVTLFVCNNPGAFVLERAQYLGVDSLMINREMWKHPEGILEVLKNRNISFIVLAGFLWLVPEAIVNAYPRRIVNIHPALLPKFGGKGMYGDAVHKAVKQQQEYETGITVHYVNARYDEGDIIFRKSTEIDPKTHSVDEIAAKVHALEYEFFPKIVEEVIKKDLKENL